MPTLPELQLAYFAQALRGLADLARTTTNDHIKLRALLELARLCNPAKPPLRSPRRRGGSSCSSPDAPRSGRGGEKATGPAPSPTPSIPDPSDSDLPRPSGALIESHSGSGGEAPPAMCPRPLRGEEHGHTSAPLSRGASPRERARERATGPAPSPTPSIPDPSSPPDPSAISAPSATSAFSSSSRSTYEIENAHRARMANQAREAIAINQSRGLPVPASWLAWARADDSS